MLRTLKSRLAKLENCRRQQGANRILEFDPLDRNSRAETLKECGQGKFLLVPSYRSMQEWEAELDKQQTKLIAQAIPQSRNET